LKGANKIDELCPPNPNEFDSATFTSHLSFCDPTNKLTSYKIENLSILDEMKHGKMSTYPIKNMEFTVQRTATLFYVDEIAGKGWSYTMCVVSIFKP
jgi:hypothetical protein